MTTIRELTDADTRDYNGLLFAVHQRAVTACNLEARAVVGRFAQITSKSFNGQPHGRSKPPLYGRTFMIEHVLFDLSDDEPQLKLMNVPLYARLSEVKIL